MHSPALKSLLHHPAPCISGFWSPCKKQFCPPARGIPRSEQQGMSLDEREKSTFASHLVLEGYIRTVNNELGERKERFF